MIAAAPWVLQHLVIVRDQPWEAELMQGDDQRSVVQGREARSISRKWTIGRRRCSRTCSEDGSGKLWSSASRRRRPAIRQRGPACRVTSRDRWPRRGSTGSRRGTAGRYHRPEPRSASAAIAGVVNLGPFRWGSPAHFPGTIEGVRGAVGSRGRSCRRNPRMGPKKVKELREDRCPEASLVTSPSTMMISPADHERGDGRFGRPRGPCRLRRVGGEPPRT